MKVLKDWEELVSELRKRVAAGDNTCRSLLERAEADLKAARERAETKRKSADGR